MKKVKAMALVAVFMGSMFYAPTAEAKKVGGGTIVHSNGCVETVEYHQALFGLITWEVTTSYICP